MGYKMAPDSGRYRELFAWQVHSKITILGQSAPVFSLALIASSLPINFQTN
jgi:hypothetical protein